MPMSAGALELVRSLRRVELLSGMTGRRRSWSLEQKPAIVSGAQECDNLAKLARRHDIRTSQLYTWRRELRYALEAAGTKNTIIEPHFVPVMAHREESRPERLPVALLLRDCVSSRPAISCR